MKKMLILPMVLIIGACTDVDGATKALDDAALNPISVGGYSIFGCSDKDTFSTKFTAKNQNGKVVTGQVCSGWFKGATIRFN